MLGIAFENDVYGGKKVKQDIAEKQSAISIMRDNAEPVQLALCNWLPELGRRRLNQVPYMSEGIIVGCLNNEQAKGSCE